MTPVGFEPTQLALVELESTPLDHSDKDVLELVLKQGLAGVRHFISIVPSAENHTRGTRCTIALYAALGMGLATTDRVAVPSQHSSCGLMDTAPPA